MHNHFKLIIEMLEAGKINPHDLTRINIYHADGCDLLENGGTCDCDPEIDIEGYNQAHARTMRPKQLRYAKTDAIRSCDGGQVL